MTGTDGVLGVVTTTGRFEYQLSGPDVLLSPGRYELRADVDVREGGLELGALDADANAWLSTARYWHGQPGFGSRDLAVPFELKKPLRVRPILSNWQHRAATSDWMVRTVWIRQA